MGGEGALEGASAGQLKVLSAPLLVFVVQVGHFTYSQGKQKGANQGVPDTRLLLSSLFLNPLTFTI